MRYIPLILLILLWLALRPAVGAGDAAGLLPAPSCGGEWRLDGKVAHYDRDTLSDRINGEAELFFPYGFDSLAYGRYARGGKAFDLDVYRMGSSLDAFGVYAGYRPDGADPLRVGSEGVVTPAQLFFYQDRYLIRLQSTGEGDTGKAVLTSCAEEVSRRLPKGEGAPKELQLLAVPEIDQGSVRYSATSLLGYDFLPKGLTADATVAGEPARAFLFIAASPAEASRALNGYRGYLEQGGNEVRQVGDGGATISAVDPLYGKSVVRQEGRHLFGMVRLKDVAAALPVMEKLRLRLAR